LKFKEDSRVLMFKEILFEDLEDELEFLKLKDIQYTTVCDPYGRGV